MVERSPWDVSRDADLMFEGHKRAFSLYHHTPVVVGIDIYNIETEAYGAKIQNPGANGIPAIHEVLFTTLDDALAIQPYDPATAGRMKMIIDVGRRLKEALPEADVKIPVSGPFSIAFNLRGITNLCEDLALRPADVATFLMTVAENQRLFCQAIIDAGLDVTFFESAASPPMLSPKLFTEIELPALRRVLSIAEEVSGHPVPCIMGGDTYRVLDAMLSTGTSFVVCNVETNQAAFVDQARKTHPHVKIRVNMDPNVVVCSDKKRIYAEIDRILELTREHPNCLMGTGCLPYETPLENIQIISEYVA